MAKDNEVTPTEPLLFSNIEQPVLLDTKMQKERLQVTKQIKQRKPTRKRRALRID